MSYKVCINYKANFSLDFLRHVALLFCLEIHDLTLHTVSESSVMFLAACRKQLSDVEYKRAKHAVTEIDRSVQSKNILKEGNYREFGKLMTKSHNSLR